MLRIPKGSNNFETALGSQSGNFSVLHQGKQLPAEEIPVRRVSATGRPIRDFDEEIVFKGGKRIIVHGNAVPLRDVKGHPAGAVAAFVDITR